MTWPDAALERGRELVREIREYGGLWLPPLEVSEERVTARYQNEAGKRCEAIGRWR